MDFTKHISENKAPVTFVVLFSSENFSIIDFIFFEISKAQ